MTSIPIKIAPSSNITDCIVRSRIDIYTSRLYATSICAIITQFLYPIKLSVIYAAKISI